MRGDDWDGTIDYGCGPRRWRVQPGPKGTPARLWIDGQEIPGRLISMEISVQWGVFEPPADERVSITERTNAIARRLVRQALGEGA